MSKLLLTFALALAPSASAQDILVLGGGGDLHSVCIDSGELTFIGAAGLTPHFWTGMAINSQGKIYATYGRYFSAYEIYEIDPNNGQAIFISQTSLFGLSALAFDDQDNLYGLNDRTAPSGTRPMDLYRIDLFTGGTTLIGDTGIRNALALDYHDGLLWTYNLGKGLQQIDPVTGIAADVNSQVVGPIGATSSLCINDSGTAYYVDGGLWMVDRETGSFSLVNFLSSFGFWGEAIFIDGPAPPQSLWLVGQTGGPVEAKVTGVTPSGNIAFVWSEGPGGPIVVPPGFPCSGVELDLASNVRLAQIVTANAQGEATLGPVFLPASAIGSFRIQAVDLNACEATNPVGVIF